MMNDPLRRTGYFFRTDDDIEFTPSEYSYFRNEEDLESFVAWFDHVQAGYILAKLEAKEDHKSINKLYFYFFLQLLGILIFKHSKPA